MRVTQIEVSYRLTESHDWSNVQLQRLGYGEPDGVCVTCRYLDPDGPHCMRGNALCDEPYCREWVRKGDA